MDQSNPTPDYELKLRYAEAVRLLEWHGQNIKKRLARNAMTLEAVVQALQEPRGAAKVHAQSFREIIKAIVRAELGGSQ